MKKAAFTIISLAMLASCGDVKEKAKDTINKTGEVVGETATELVEGVTEGVEKIGRAHV